MAADETPSPTNRAKVSSRLTILPPGQPNNLTIFESIYFFFNFFGLGQDWRKFIRARAQMAHNYCINS